MRLRTRLFVYTGSVFLAIGIFSFFLQNHVIKSNLLKEKNSLHKEIQRLNEKQMKSLALYVEEMLLDYKTKINAVLAAFLQYPVLRQDFNPGTMPTWLDSATLIMNNKWLDVVENIKNKKVASSILLQERPLPRVPCKVLGQEAMVAWLEGGRPVVAVPWFVAPRGEVTPKEALPTSFYALFDVETLLQIDASQQKIEKLQLHIEPLHLFLQWMQLQEYTTLLQNFMQSLQKTQEELKKDPELLKGLLQPTQESKELMAGSAESSLAKLIDHYDEIGMIWGFAMLLQTGFFGESPFNPKAPLGIMKVEQGKPYGDILLKEAVFTTKPSLYALEGHPPSSIWQETLKVILFKESGRFFLGNSLHLTQGTDESTLTIGVDGDVVCRDLALATDKEVVFVAGNKVVRTFNTQGQAAPPIDLTQLEIDTLLKEPYGILSYKGVSYFFLHIAPFAGEDFHFFVLAPEKQVFFLVDELNSALAWLIQHIGVQMGCTAVGMFLLLLFLLDRIAKRISRPIRELALATEPIKEGHFESVKLSSKDFTAQDEVHTLYTAFEGMVQGLQEKEKVRGILNKVVSTEIANEILKTDVPLGGEEKEITIVFADIRHFTAMTERMSPKEVVALLNACMTKVSKVIDAHHGVIDKYIGDGVMALFGVPLTRPYTRLEATLAAIEIMEVLATWNLEREKAHLGKVEMGIGIHYGKALVGNMGAENRLNYTALGAEVNLASRICAKASPSEILISKAVYEEPSLRQRVKVEAVEPLELKGFSHKVEAFRVMSVEKTSPMLS